MAVLIKVEKIRLIHQLSTLINAGLSPSDAIAKLRASNVLISNFLRKTASQLRKGKPLSEALSESGLLNHIDLVILSIAETSGQLCSGLVDIHKRLEKRHYQIKALKQKCYLPLATLAIAILATTLISLTRDTPLQAFFQLLKGISYFLIIIFSMRFFLKRSDNAGYVCFNFSGVNAHLDR